MAKNPEWQVGRALWFLPFAILVLSLGGAFLYWGSVRRQETLELKAYFDFRVREASAKVVERMNAYKHVLLATGGLFSASTDVDRQEFSRFVESLQLEEQYPGIQGVGFSKLIPAARLAQHEQDIRAQGFPAYKVRPPGPRDPYSSIIYLEPFRDRNLRAFGYDMYSEAVRRQAMAQARDTGLAALSGKVLLVQETETKPQAGVLLYVPVYANGAPHATLEQRRANLVGWAYAPFRMDDLMGGLFGERASDLETEIYDGPEIAAATLLYDSHPMETGGTTIPLVSTNRVRVAGHPWTLIYRAMPALQSRVQGKRSWVLLAAGILASFLLFLATWLLVLGRARALRLASERETRFKMLMQQASDGIHILDAQGRLVEASGSFHKALGYAPGELAGKKLPLWDAQWKDDELFDRLRRLQGETEEHSVFETAHRRKDGSVFPVEISCIGVVLDGQGYLFASARDISERKAVQEALSAEKEHLAVTLMSIGDGVITTDASGQVVLLNQVAEKITGWASAEARGKRLPEVFRIVDENSRVARANPVERVLSSGAKVELEDPTCLVSRDGRDVLIEDSAAPILSRSGRILGVVLVFRDITEKRKLRDSLQRSQRLESLGNLASGIAHDFNNLMAGVFINLGIAQEQLQRADLAGAAKHLEKSLSVLQRSRNLANQLLTFSKGGHPVLKSQKILPSIRKWVEFSLTGSKIDVDFQVDDPEASGLFDENQLAQVVENLVLNARQAMGEQGRLRIALRRVAPEEAPRNLAPRPYLCLSISDNGPGIRPEHLVKLFDPFFTTKALGNGLGLTTSLSILQKHGGTILVDSVPGQGATFHLFLPQSLDKPAPIPRATQGAAPRGGHILVLDDADYLLTATQAQLEFLGFRVTCATHGEEALAKARQARAAQDPMHLAILDLTIPGGLGGREIVAPLLEIFPGLVAIASSGFADNPVMASPGDYGFAACLPKPYSNEELKAVLDRIQRAGA